MICRVLKRPDGGVSVIHPVPKSKRPDETETQWLERVFTKANPLGLPYVDMDSSELPSTREDRNVWEWDNVNKKIKVDAFKAKENKDKKEREVKIQDEMRRLAEKSLKDKGEL